MHDEPRHDAVEEQTAGRKTTSHDDARERSSETRRRRAAEGRLDTAIGREPHDVRHGDQTDSGDQTYGTPDDPTFSAG